MNDTKIVLTVYGAEEKCASCIHLPSAKETMEWLEAALGRKFPDRALTFRYVDIETAESKEDQRWSQAILNDDYFYPLVVLDGEVVAEGDPHLPQLVKRIEQLD